MSDILINVDELKFDERGLIPAIVTDYATRRVLMLAYMNRESLQISIEKGLTCFWSRSRQKLWTKGETSGNYQHIISITADCDRDTLLIAVKTDGPACHLGTTSCFEYPVWESDEQEEFSIDGLYKMIEGRKVNKKEGSYTTYLFEKGLDKILKKVGEECTEIIVAAKNPDPEELKYELADWLYHAMVLMVEKGVTWEDVTKEIVNR